MIRINAISFHRGYLTPMAARNELGVLCAAIQPKIGAAILARVNITQALALGVACVGIANPCLAQSFNCQYAKTRTR